MGGPPVCDGQEHLPLDNFAICRVLLDGEIWDSAEQYYQAAKFADAGYREAIRAVKPRRNVGTRICANLHGREVWQMGQSQDHAHVEGFRKLEAMYVANRAKFDQNPDFRRRLLETHGPIQAAASTGEWQHWNSRILERIREELRPPADRDDAKLQDLLEEFARADGFDGASARERVEAASRAFGVDQRHVIVTLMDGETLDVYLQPQDSILVLKEHVAFQLGIHASRLKLLLMASVLEDTQTLESSRVEDGTALTAIIASPVPHEAQTINAELHNALAAAGRLLPGAK